MGAWRQLLLMFLQDLSGARRGQRLGESDVVQRVLYVPLASFSPVKSCCGALTPQRSHDAGSGINRAR